MLRRFRHWRCATWDTNTGDQRHGRGAFCDIPRTGDRWQIRDEADTPAVAKARKLVEQHDAKKNQRADALYAEMTKAAREVDSEVLFAPDANAALEAVKKFEAMAKRKGWIRAV